LGSIQAFHGEVFCAWGGFQSKKFSMEKDIFGCEFPKRNFTLGAFDRNHVQNALYLSYFLFANSILHLEIFQGKFTADFDFHENISRKVGYPELSEERLEIKLFFNKSMLGKFFRRNCLHEILRRKEDLEQGWNCMERI